MATLDDRLAAASAFLLQSPPGEVNDVFSDIRTLVAADAELEPAILPALKQYNRQQLTIVDLGGKKALVSPVSRLPVELGGDEESDETPEERHVDPRSQQSFVFDHMKVTATSAAPLPVDADTETLRAQLDKLLDAYVQNHYSDGVSAVYVLDDPAYPPAPESEPEPARVAAEEEEGEKKDGAEEHGIGETGSVAADVEGSAEAVADAAAETAEQAEEALPKDEGEVAQGGAGEAAAEAAEGEDAKMEAATPAAEVEEEEKVEDPPAPVEKKEPKARPSRLFGLYFVGNKYNPSNYWTGRWRATYDFDYEKGTLEGTAQIQVHYYEQGNVQLSTTLRSSTPLSSQPPAEAVIAAVKSSEASFQRQLSSTYASLSDEGFRGLRRALPKTKAKINWEAVGGMRLGKQIGGGQ